MQRFNVHELFTGYKSDPTRGDYSENIVTGRPFVAQNSKRLTDDLNYWCQLRVLPGDPTAYDPLKFNEPYVSYGNNPVTITNAPTIAIGVTDDPLATYSSYAQAVSMEAAYTTGMLQNYPCATATYGDSMMLTVAFGASKTSPADTAYNLDGVALRIFGADSLLRSTTRFIFAGGLAQSKLPASNYKVFRGVIPPAIVKDWGSTPAFTADIVLTDSSGTPVYTINSGLGWNNISLVSFNTTNNVPEVYYSSFLGSPKEHLRVPTHIPALKPSTKNLAWQRVMPDYSSTTIPTDSYAIGTVAANPTRSNVVSTLMSFRNTDMSGIGYKVTSIVATLTSTLATLLATMKTSLAGDFVVKVSDPNNSFATMTFPAFTASGVVQTLTLPDFTLPALETLVFEIIYAPAVKILGTNAYLSPYIVATAAGLAAAANIRKMNIQVKGYRLDGATTPVNIGAPLLLTATV